MDLFPWRRGTERVLRSWFVSREQEFQLPQLLECTGASGGRVGGALGSGSSAVPACQSPKGRTCPPLHHELTAL